jgi:hypothetical protein
MAAVPFLEWVTVQVLSSGLDIDAGQGRNRAHHLFFVQR